MPLYDAIIAGTGHYVPEKRLTNEDLSKIVETDDEWIVQRTGIRERRIVAKDESVATLASHAATNALRSARMEPKDLDCIIVATVVPEMQMPATACFVAKSLGLDRTPAFDILAACSGFIYALDVATAYVQAGRYRNVLIIGSETLTRITDYTDRSSCILFGDGAGAAIISRHERGSGGQRQGVLYSSLYADGGGWEMLYLLPGSRHPIDERLIAARSHYLKIRGREVYKFAVGRFIEMIEDAMTRCELKPADVKLVVPHQVNQRIIDSAMEKLGFPPEKAFVNIDRYGNTSSASIPIALDEAVRQGRLSAGDVVVMVAFGAGLTWANAVVRM
jgi:3-oxoacyl-[acyl-carrier-protein] synthase-3